MMLRAVSVMLAAGMFCGVAFVDQDRGNVIRPKKIDAKVKGCRVSEPGKYLATVGDLIELEYMFPVVPAAVPKSVDQQADKGVIGASKLGIRNLVVPEMLGAGAYVFYFEAKRKGAGAAFVLIDDVKYEFRFDVSDRAKKKP